jgi:hypothetical protein
VILSSCTVYVYKHDHEEECLGAGDGTAAGGVDAAMGGGHVAASAAGPWGVQGAGTAVAGPRPSAES